MPAWRSALTDSLGSDQPLVRNSLRSARIIETSRHSSLMTSYLSGSLGTLGFNWLRIVGAFRPIDGISPSCIAGQMLSAIRQKLSSCVSSRPSPSVLATSGLLKSRDAGSGERRSRRCGYCDTMTLGLRTQPRGVRATARGRGLHWEQITMQIDPPRSGSGSSSRTPRSTSSWRSRPHVVPPVLRESGLVDASGCVSVDPNALETK